MRGDETPDRETILRVAKEYLASTGALSPSASSEGDYQQPLAIRDPGGKLHSWIVPITVSDRLAGFVRVGLDLTPLGYSTFQRHAGELAGCPEAALWLDPKRIKQSAAASAQEGERLSEPLLTFDEVSSRLAWAVKATMPTGKERTLFVAGSYVYSKD